MRKKKSKQSKGKKPQVFYIVYDLNQIEVCKTLHEVRDYISREAESENLHPDEVESRFDVYEVKRQLKFEAFRNFSYHISFE